MTTVKRALDEVGHEGLAQLLAGTRAEVIRILGEKSGMRFRYVLEMWHRGQEYPIEVHLDAPPAGPADMDLLRDRFRARYRELYGRVDDDNVVELVAVRALGSFGRGIGAVRLAGEAQPVTFRDRRLYDPAAGCYQDVPVLARARLVPNQPVEGPLVIQDRESGIVIRAGDRLQVRDNGAIFVELRDGTGARGEQHEQEAEGIA
jgi:N-methylhydantoinase A